MKSYNTCNNKNTHRWLSTRKKKWIFSSVLLFAALVSTVLALVLTLGRSNDKPSHDGITTKLSEISKNEYFTYVIKDNTTSTRRYNIPQTEYAVITGLSQSAINEITNNSNSVYKVVFPSEIYVADSTGNIKSYPVCEINTMNFANNVDGEPYKKASMLYSSFSWAKSEKGLKEVGNSDAATKIVDGSTYPDKITEIVVQDSVQYIAEGSFHGLDHLESVTLPFIGTERGNLASGSGVAAFDGYLSAFGAVFGHGNQVHGNSSSEYFPVTDARHISYLDANGKILDLNDQKGFKNNGAYYLNNTYYSWYNNEADINAQTNLNMPADLKNIKITTEISVANHAFFNLFNVENISVGFQAASSSLTDANVIGEYAFAKCVRLVHATLPGSVSDISTTSAVKVGTFNECYKLKTVQFPKNLKEISDSMFYRCYELESLQLPNGVEKIGDHAFDECKSLSSLYPANGKAEAETMRLPETIKSIGTSAFRACASFKTVVVPNQTRSIGQYAFDSCTSLTTLTIPFIGSRAGTTGSEEALFGWIFGRTTDQTSTSSGTTSVKQNITGSQTDTDQNNIFTYYIPTTLKNLFILNETVVAPGSLMNVTTLETLSIQYPSLSDTKMRIAEGALSGCGNIKNLTIPFVGEYDWVVGESKCKNATLGWIFGTEAYTGSYAVDAYIENHEAHDPWQIPTSLKKVQLEHQTYLPSYSFYKTNKIEEIVIGKSTIRSEASAFFDVISLKRLELPFVGDRRTATIENNYYEWGPYRSYRCSLYWNFTSNSSTGNYLNDANYFYQRYIPESLEEVTITDDTYFLASGFQGFKSLKKISIKTGENEITGIEGGLFYGCSSLETLEIPYIGSDKNTDRVDSWQHTIHYFFGTTEYDGTYKADLYNNTWYIPKTLSSITIEDNINCIPAYAFYKLSSVNSISTDAQISSISTGSFGYCTNLTILKMDNASYSNVADYAFINDYSLGETNKFLPNTVRTIGDYALSGTAITTISDNNVDLKKKITSLGTGALAKCQNIASFNFDDYISLTSVGSYLFSGCKNLSDVKLNRFLTNYMFQDCISLSDINLIKVIDNLPDSSTKGVTIPDGLFDGCVSLNDADYKSGKGLIIGDVSNSNANVNTIGEYAFRGCVSLTHLDLPNKLLEIRDGAFQNCTMLKMLRIPRDCYIMNEGTNKTTGEDYLNTGIFYGCNSDFYLEVYPDENQWPSTWGYNWNCYFPVNVIGGSSAEIFTYEYDSNLRGYIITGLNFEKNTFVTRQGSYLEYLLSDTITFPATYMGLPVYGIKDNAFADNGTNGQNNPQDAFSQVDRFILGANFTQLGSDSLTFEKVNPTTGATTGVQRTVYIFSQKTSAQSAAEPLLHTGAEITFSKRAMTFYKEAWKFVGTRPVILLDALSIKFENDSYMYALGKQIIPEIVDISAKGSSSSGVATSAIRYSNEELIVENGEDYIKNIFYDFTPGVGYQNLNLKNINIQYSNNVNVGKGLVSLSSNCADLFGTKKIYFDITPIEIDLFTESDDSDTLFKKYGVDASNEPLYKNAYNLFLNLYYMYYSTYGNKIPQAEIKNEPFLSTFFAKYANITYGNVWTHSNWELGSSVLNIPEGYRMTGVLTTSSNNRGIYLSYKTEKYGDLSAFAGSVGGFTWLESPHIYNAKGEDVTDNFTFMITNCVVINPFTLDPNDITWDGSKGPNESVWKYGYTGEAIVPVPKISGQSFDLASECTVEVYITGTQTQATAIDPFDIDHKLYQAKIVHVSNNFELGANVVSMEFKIVASNVNVQISMVHTILENEDYYRYSGPYVTSKGDGYSITVTGLGKNSYITGDLETSGYAVGTYRNGDNLNFNFGIQTGGAPFKIYSSTRTDVSGPLEEGNQTGLNAYYNVSFEMRCEIKWQTFDARLEIEDRDNKGNKIAYEANEKNVYPKYSLVESSLKEGEDLTNGLKVELTYGTDGYEHPLTVNVLNSKATNLGSFLSNNITSDGKFVIKEPGSYSVELTLKKEKYETMVVYIVINVVKGNYILADLSKEYDRNQVNVFDVFARLPIDFDESKIHYQFYNAATSEAINAPSNIGSYYVIIETDTDHSKYFNDIPNAVVNNKVSFIIYPRKITIDVEDPINHKVYDGYPWSYNAVDDNKTSLNLLPGDSLTGKFQSRSNKVGTYDSKNKGDFFNVGGFTVTNSSFSDNEKDQTKNYQIVFKGSFEIKPKTMKYTSYGGDFDYDGRYHTISVLVEEPTDNYTIYYSETGPVFDAEGNDVGEWSPYPYYYIEPNSGTDSYLVYFKIVADTYKTVYDHQKITITGRSIKYTFGQIDFVYDGFDHSPEVIPTDPKYATIEYAPLKDPSNTISDALEWSSVPPSYVDCGNYYLAFRLSAVNYQPVEGKFTMTISDKGPKLDGLFNLEGENTDFDTLYHGVLLNKVSSSLDLTTTYFYYAEEPTSSYDAKDLSYSKLDFTADQTVAGQYYNRNYRDAGIYKLVIRVLKPGYHPYYKVLTVTINKLKLYLEASFYNNYYDGEYHAGGLKLKNNAPNTDELTSTGTLADGDISYRYKTVINGEDYYVPLTVRYGVKPLASNPGTPAMSEEILKYKDACSYLMTIQAEASNFEMFEQEGAFEIKQNKLFITVNDPVEIQYLGRSVEPQDFLEREEVNAATGAKETIHSIQTWFDDTMTKLVAHDGELLMKFQEYNSLGVLQPSYISNPINIGHYKATYRFTSTNNCFGTEWAEFDFYIVPRVLEVTYKEELEYNAEPQIPAVSVLTGTSDIVTYKETIVNPSYIPTIPGDYKFKLVDLTSNPNYRLSTKHAADLDYKIINRKVYVTYDDEEEYTSNYVTISTKYQGDVCLDNPKFKVTNLLADDVLSISLTSQSFRRSTYLFTDAIFKFNPSYTAGSSLDQYIKTSDSTDSQYYQFDPASVTINDHKTSDVQKYYDVILNVKMVIKRPNLEVQYDEEQQVVFDGYEHGIDFTITSPGYTVGTFTYWVEGEENKTSNTMITRRDVGSYNICFKIESPDFEPYVGKIKLTIKRAILSINLKPYSGIYDGNDQKTTYDILNNPMKLLPIEMPELFYIRKEYVDNLGYTMRDLTNFFQNNTPVNDPLYDLYHKRESVMHNAGDYYAIAYYPQYPESYSANIEGVFAIENVRIEYRTLWFKSTLNNPIIKWKIYNTFKYGEDNLLLPLGDFIYDTDPSCPNFLSQNGLVLGDSIVGGNTNLGNYLVQTISPNARGNADGENNGDPYQFEGDFEFRYIDIVNSLGQQMSSNYRPAFEQMEYNGAQVYPLQITIKRATLNVFEVTNAVKEYTSGEVYPNIMTPSDGSIDAFYYATDSAYTEPAISGATKMKGAPIDVGYYWVFVHVNQGTNYLEWKYPDSPQPNDYLDPDTGAGYRFAKLQITPKTVVVDWGSEWEDNNYTITFDGKMHSASPRIELVSGAYQYLYYKVLDVRGNEVGPQSVINAGYYYFRAELTGPGFSGTGNYKLLNNPIMFTILKRPYFISEETKEPWLKSNWYKDYTGDDLDGWVPGYSIKLHIETVSDQSGTYKNASDFKVTAVVTDEQIMPNVTEYVGVDPTKLGTNDARLINVFEGQTFSVADNFEFNLNMLITLENKDLKVNKSDVDVLYQNRDISPNIKITSYKRGYTVYYSTAYIYEDPNTGDQTLYRYDATSGEIIKDGNGRPEIFDEGAVPNDLHTMPTFRNVGYYKVYYYVTVPGDDGVTNTYSGSTTVRIRQRDSYITIDKLDKVYDGAPVNASSIQVMGGYNGTRSNLQFLFKEVGSTKDFSADAPVHVGTYQMKIVNDADNNNDYPQNYSPIDVTGNVFTFTISPATIVLEVANDITITGPVSNLSFMSKYSSSTSALTETSTSSSVIKSSKPTITGLYINDTFNFTIMSLPGVSLSRGKYEYTDGLASFDDNRNFLNTPNLLNITWDAHYGGASEKSKDYMLKLVYSLNIHYPYMKVETNNVSADYTGNDIYLMSLTNPAAINVQYPTSGNLTYKFGDTSSNLDRTGDYSQSKPGTYNVYFSIEAQYFEPYTGVIKFTINAISRDGMLTDEKIDKEYDAVVYDGKTTGVPNIRWKDTANPINDLPDKASWTIQYFHAISGDNGVTWSKASDAITSVVDADDYIYRVIIPAYGIYSETIVERYFKISRKTYEINGPDVTIKYNGGIWVCDLVAGGYTTTGLNPGHTLDKATVITSSGNVGKYTQTGSGMYISDAYKYIITDAKKNDVTKNYEYRLNFTLEITKGDMTFRSTIPDNGQYVFSGTKISPTVFVIEPSKLPEDCEIEYSLDGLNGWSTDPTTIGHIDVGKYSFFARLLNVPNYNDKTEKFEFEIVKQQRTINIFDLSKEYDGAPCDWPTITTQGDDKLSGVITDTNARGIKIEWYADDKVTKLASRPTDAGNYYVKIIYPSDGDYAGTEAMAAFEITPCVISLNVASINLTYNAQGQAPSVKLIRKNKPSFDISNLLGANYSVQYYTQKDIYHANGVSAKYKDVGLYQVGYALLGDAKNNFVFDLTNNDKVYVDYRITKRVVNVTYKGQLDATSISGSTYVINRTDMTIKGLEETSIQFASNIILKSLSAGIYQAQGNYDSQDFKNSFGWSTTTSTLVNKPILIYSGSDEDIDTNYIINVDLSVKVSEGALPYTVAPYDGVYDGQAHTFTFKLNNNKDPNALIEYSTDSSSWSTVIPEFTNVTKIPQHIYVRITSSVYNNGNPITLGMDPAQPDYDSFTVNITKAHAEINYSEIDLGDKVYDDKDIVDPDVTVTPIFGNNVKLNVEYRYYQLDYASGATVYKQVDRISVRNVGSYYLEVRLVNNENYEDTKDSEVIPIYFKITPRKLVISLKNESKPYDMVPWQTNVSNIPSLNGGSTLTGVSGITESGLVAGHYLVGVVQTVKSDAGRYSLSSDFCWENGVRIYKTDLNTSQDVDILLDNYDIIFDFDVNIAKIQFDITFNDVHGVYDGKTLYYISHKWNKYPSILVPTGLNALDFYDSLIEYNEESFKSTSWQITPIGKLVGTTTIYIKVHDPNGNYEDYLTTAQIIVEPLEASFDVIDLGVLASDVVYSGNKYDESTIVVKSSIPNDTRTVYFKYYLRNADGSRGTALSGPPTNADKYILTMCLDADPAKGLSAVEMDVHFNIIPAKIPVYWGANIVDTTTDPSKYIYKMYYTGSVVHPLAQAYSIINIGAGTAHDPWYESIPLDVTVNSQYDGINKGKHLCEAKIHVDSTNLYYKNYELINPTLEYEIIDGMPFNPDNKDPIYFPSKPDPGNGFPGGAGGNPGSNNQGGDKTPGNTPPENSNSMFEGIEFRVDQFNPLATVANTPFKYLDDEIVLEVIYHYSNPSDDKTYIFHLDQKTWKILQIRDNTDTNIIDANPSVNFSFVFPDPLQTPTFDVTAVLTDKTNNAWNTNGDKADRTIKVHLEPKALDPNNPGSSDYIWLETPKNNSLTASTDSPRSPVVYAANDSTKPNEYIRVWQDINATPNDPTDDFEIVITNYTIYYGNNLNPTPTNATNPDDYAYFIVKSNPGGLYSFEFGDYTLYEAEVKSHTSNPDWITENAAPNVAQKAAFTFVIVSPEPSVIELLDDAKNADPKPKFVRYEQDFNQANSYALTYTYGISNSDRETDQALSGMTSIADRKEFSIKLSHIPERQNLDYVLSNIKNKREFLALYAEDGTCLWDGAGIQSGTLNPSSTSVDDYIASGMYFVLYDSNTATRKPLDAIEIVVVGDTNGDGIVSVADVVIVNNNILTGYSAGRDSDYKNSKYLAGLVVGSSIQSVTCTVMLNNAILNYGTTDIIEQNFYSNYQ